MGRQGAPGPTGHLGIGSNRPFKLQNRLASVCLCGAITWPARRQGLVVGPEETQDVL